MSNEKYTKEQLEKTTVAILRSILASKGVAPLNKPKDELIKEILSAQDGILLPERSKKGRPRLSGVEPYKPDIPTSFNFNTPNPESVENLPKFNGSNNVYGAGVVSFGQTETVNGVLDIGKDGNGFLRVNLYSADPYVDVFVSKDVINSFGLLTGDTVEGIAVYDGILNLKTVNKLNGKTYEKKDRVNFEDLSPCYTNEKFKIASENDIAMQVVDLLAPIGKGQRAIIYAPEKSCKSKILKRIVSKIEDNHNDVKIINLLINRRPEEVTEYKKGLSSEIISLDYNTSCETQVKASELVLNRAKRLVEEGYDVLITIDDIISLVKAYNYALNTVKTFGGIDVDAVIKTKQFFATARNIENGGSLTIICTADVNSSGDELILNELRSVSNMQMELSLQPCKSLKILLIFNFRRQNVRQNFY